VRVQKSVEIAVVAAIYWSVTSVAGVKTVGRSDHKCCRRRACFTVEEARVCGYHGYTIFFLGTHSGGPRKHAHSDEMCVNAACPVPTACAWKPVTCHHRHRVVGVPGLTVHVGKGSSENVRYEIFYSDASRTGPFATVVCQSHSPSPSLLARVLRITPPCFFPLPFPR